MSPLDIAIIVIVSVAVVGVIFWLVYRKIKHKGGCCDCSSCNGSCPCCDNKKDNTSDT